MIIKFVALSALTAAGVGTVIALNPPASHPSAPARTGVITPKQTVGSTGSEPSSGTQVENLDGPPAQISPDRHQRFAPNGHHRPQYVPPHGVDPSGRGLSDDGKEFEGDWSEHEGWQGGWDDDAPRPHPHDTRPPHGEDDEQENGR